MVRACLPGVLGCFKSTCAGGETRCALDTGRFVCAVHMFATPQREHPAAGFRPHTPDCGASLASRITHLGIAAAGEESAVEDLCGPGGSSRSASGRTVRLRRAANQVVHVCECFSAAINACTMALDLQFVLFCKGARLRDFVLLSSIFCS